MSCLALHVAKQLKTWEIKKLETLQKYQNWVDKQPSAESPFKKFDFLNSSSKHAKADAKLFFSCLVLVDYYIFFQIIFPGLHEQANFLYLVGLIPFRLRLSGMFYNSKAFV